MWVWIAYIIGLCLFIFVLLFGQSNTFRRTSIGKAHEFLTETVPHGIYLGFWCCLGEKRVDALYKYAFEGRNPILQLFYLSLITGCIGLFLYLAWNRIPNKLLSEYHRYIIPIAITTVYFCFFKASWSDSGAITKENVNRAIELWDYDYILFNPKECSTCNLLKPARSKHCSICNKCVAKADHHCAWINNCVGHNNYRYFLSFLGSTAAVCMYGSYMLYRIVQNEMDVRNVWNFSVYDREKGTRTPITTWQAIMYIVQLELHLCALGLFAGLAGLVVFIFMLYQLSMVVRGFTTNESFKWEDLDYDIRTGSLTEIPADLYKYNKNYRSERKNEGEPFAPSYDGKVKKVPIKGVNEIKNIYDLGWLGNLHEVLFPQPLYVLEGKVRAKKIKKQ
ncbi:hypothetical protein HK101_004239 [Irineochytrium annulatum]|nr:hypothetical protein HK101_004239 [Irineochytrium annulatum]